MIYIDKKIVLLLTVILFLSFSVTIVNTSGEKTAVNNLRIAMLDLSPRFKENKPLIISGFYHTIEFDTNKKPDINLTNDNTTYHWFYDDGWGGDLGYLDKGKSRVSGSHYKMVVGIEVNEKKGTWSLQVNGEKYDVIVDNPVRGFGMHIPDFTFRFKPFTSTTKSSDPQRYTLESEGNSVLHYKTHFKKFNSRINVSNPEGIIKPGSEITSTISFTSKKWKPGYLNFSGEIAVHPVNIVSNATYHFVPEYKLDINGQVIVGHKGYEIKELSDGITIQYKENIEVYYGEKKKVNFYISGDERLNLDILTKKLEMKSFSGMGKNKVPTTVDLEPGQEYKFEVRLKPTKKETTGLLTYSLNGQTEEKKYTTEVKILRPLDGYDESPEQGFAHNKDINIIVILTGISLFVGYLIVSRSKGGE